MRDDPRLLLIDMTPIGGSAATSALKMAYFGDWAEDALLHVLAGGPGAVALASGADGARDFAPDAETASRLVEAFRPQIILYRPVADRPELHDFAMALLNASAAPLALWMMDDWPERLRAEDKARIAAIDADLRRLFRRSKANFAISKGMAGAFGARYKTSFEVAHNGVAPEDWPARLNKTAGKKPADKIRLRYAGSLAPDMTKDSVFAAAKAVSALVEDGRPIVFEGRTQANWLEDYGAAFNALAGVSMRAADMSPEDYRVWLSGADIVLVAYNFDAATHRYLQYSFANKIPEALASGAAVLACGPATLETIAYLKNEGVAAMVEEEGTAPIKSALSDLIDDPLRRAALASAGRAHAFGAFNLNHARDAMRRELGAIAAPAPDPGDDAAFEDGAQFDECRFVFELLNAREAPGVMVDVGAGVGVSLKPFAEAGWRVHAFESDRKNRAKLKRATACNRKIRIAPMAADGGIEAQSLADIGILKIDGVGRVMDILNGFDFARATPRAIVAAFESVETAASVCAMDDLANRLIAAGYVVYVSEQHPAAPGGAAQSWRRLKRYPAKTAPGAWGRLIALREQPGAAVLRRAFARSLRGGCAGLGASGAILAVLGEPPRPSLYRRIANWLERRAPWAFRLLRGHARAIRTHLSRPRLIEETGQRRRHV